jgi:alpha-amylase
VDEWQKLQATVDVDRPLTLWRFPIETVSLSEAGFERVYQSSVVFLHSKFRLDEKFDLAIKLTLGKTK